MHRGTLHTKALAAIAIVALMLITSTPSPSTHIARAGDPGVKGSMSLKVNQYPGSPHSLEPVLIYVKGVNINNIKLKVNIDVAASAKAAVVHAPECYGNFEIKIYVHLANGTPASGALILAKNTLGNEICSTHVNSRGEGILRLNRGSYMLVAFYDADSDNLYEYAGTAIAHVGLIHFKYTEITVRPLTEIIDEELYKLGKIRYTIEEPMMKMPPHYYLAFIPGLPAARIRLEGAVLNKILGNISSLINEFYINISSAVRYDVLADGHVFEYGYRVESKAPSGADLPPIALALVSESLKKQSPDNAYALSTPGWSVSHVESVNVSVIAFDDKQIKDIKFYVSINGGAWNEVKLKPLPIMEELKKYINYYNKIIADINELFYILSRHGIKVGAPYNPRPPSLILDYALIPPQKPGSYVLFKAMVSDGNHTFTSPVGVYYVYRRDSARRVLIVDPGMLLWLAKRNIKAYEGLAGVEYGRRLPIFSDVAGSYGELSDALDAFQTFHHWEYLSSKYRIMILANVSNLSTELERYKPDVVILSNLWLALNSTGNPLLDWDLLDARQASALINYVKRSHAGLVVTHGSLSDLIVWIYQGAAVRKVKIMSRGHVGDTLKDVSMADEATIAGCVGLNMLPLYEYLRDEVAGLLIKYSAVYPQAGTLGALIGSTPLLVPWVPWNGSLKATNDTRLLGWSIPREPVEIPNPYSRLDPNTRAYTLVGWQLGSPLIQARIHERVFREALRSAAAIAREYYVGLDKLADGALLGVNVSAPLYNSLRGNMSFIYDILSNMTIRGDKAGGLIAVRGLRVPVNITIPAKALELAMILSPTKLAAVSPDGLAGIVAYDRYWDPSSGFRAVYFSFEVEAGTNGAARELLLEAVDWVLKWKPLALQDIRALLIKAFADSGAASILAHATIIGYNATIATHKGSELDYTVKPGVYYILVKSVREVSVYIGNAVVEESKNLPMGVKILKINAKTPTTLRVVIKGASTPTLIVLAQAKGGTSATSTTTTATTRTHTPHTSSHPPPPATTTPPRHSTATTPPQRATTTTSSQSQASSGASPTRTATGKPEGPRGYSLTERLAVASVAAAILVAVAVYVGRARARR